MPCIDTVQGFYFCPAAIQPHTSVYSAFCAVNAIRCKTAHMALQWLFWLFAVFYAYYSAVYPAILYSLQGAGGHTSKRNTSSAYQIPPPRRTLYRSAQPSIIIRYIRVYLCAPVMDPCQTVQHIADHARQTRSAPAACESLAWSAPGAPAEGAASPPVQCQPGILHPAGHSGGRGAVGGAEPLAALAASLFGLSPDS